MGLRTVSLAGISSAARAKLAGNAMRGVCMGAVLSWISAFLEPRCSSPIDSSPTLETEHRVGDDPGYDRTFAGADELDGNAPGGDRELVGDDELETSTALLHRLDRDDPGDDRKLAGVDDPDGDDPEGDRELAGADKLGGYLASQAANECAEDVFSDSSDCGFESTVGSSPAVGSALDEALGVRLRLDDAVKVGSCNHRVQQSTWGSERRLRVTIGKHSAAALHIPTGVDGPSTCLAAGRTAGL